MLYTFNEGFSLNYCNELSEIPMEEEIEALRSWLCFNMPW